MCNLVIEVAKSTLLITSLTKRRVRIHEIVSNTPFNCENLKVEAAL